MTTEPTRLFPGFYGNQTVRDILAPQARWTVSDSRKMPVDMRALLADGQVRGARQHDESCLVTLDELTSGLPGATNCAYWLDASLDGVVVIDIERTCPPEISAPILELGSLYSEVSMSSLGYHLLMPLPTSFYDMPAGSRSVLRAEHGYWEVLQRHWVTFTRRPVPTGNRLRDPSDGVDTSAWDALWRSLAEAHGAPAPIGAVAVEADEPESIEELRTFAQEVSERWFYHRSLKSFNNDHSRYEWGAACYFYHACRSHLRRYRRDDRGYTSQEAAWILYLVLKDKIPYRPKHDETRNGLPLLLSTATRVVSRMLEMQAQTADSRNQERGDYLD